MKYVYCHECGRVSTNIWTEHNVCTYCGHAAEAVRVGRPWQYYASTVVLLGAAAAFVLLPPQDDLVKSVVLIAVLIAAFGLSGWGLTATRTKILKVVRVRDAGERGSP